MKRKSAIFVFLFYLLCFFQSTDGQVICNLAAAGVACTSDVQCRSGNCVGMIGSLDKTCTISAIDRYCCNSSDCFESECSPDFVCVAATTIPEATATSVCMPDVSCQNNEGIIEVCEEAPLCKNTITCALPNKTCTCDDCEYCTDGWCYPVFNSVSNWFDCRCQQIFNETRCPATTTTELITITTTTTTTEPTTTTTTSIELTTTTTTTTEPTTTITTKPTTTKPTTTKPTTTTTTEPTTTTTTIPPTTTTSTIPPTTTTTTTTIPLTTTTTTTIPPTTTTTTTISPSTTTTTTEPTTTTTTTTTTEPTSTTTILTTTTPFCVDCDPQLECCLNETTCKSISGGSCSLNSECSSGQCTALECAYPSLGQTCCSTGECVVLTPGAECINAVCAYPPSIPCGSNSCNSSFSCCIADECKLFRGRANCTADPLICATGSCNPSGICESTNFTTGCCRDDDCRNRRPQCSYLCQNNVCVPGPTSNATVSQCPTFPPASTTTTKPGTTTTISTTTQPCNGLCNVDLECCLNGVCRGKLSSFCDIDDPQYCLSEICDPLSICNLSPTFASCCDNVDCFPDNECLNNICIPKTATTTTQPCGNCLSGLQCCFNETTCKLLPGVTCGLNSECSSGQCTASVCAHPSSGQTCCSTNDCIVLTPGAQCINAVCVPPPPPCGGLCNPNQCCLNNLCYLGANGLCDENLDCVSGECIGQRCSYSTLKVFCCTSRDCDFGLTCIANKCSLPQRIGSDDSETDTKENVVSSSNDGEVWSIIGIVICIVIILCSVCILGFVFWAANKRKNIRSSKQTLDRKIKSKGAKGK